MIFVLVLLALALLLAPLLAAIPGASPVWGMRDAPSLDVIWDYTGWPAIACALILLAGLAALSHARHGTFSSTNLATGKTLGERAETAFAALVVIALLSLALRLVLDRGIAYSGPMLDMWVVLAADFALFALCRRVARSGRFPAYALILVIVVTSAIVADIGVNEYLYYHRVDPSRRIFATSTPDFLAGYMVMALPLTLSLFVGVPLQKQRRPLIGALLAVLSLVILAYQTMTLLRTQSRFGLVSLAVSLAVFIISLWRARRAGMMIERSSWWRLAGIGAFIVLVGVGFARPVLNRLQGTSVRDNSTAFRFYTWRGSVKMAAANPVLGTGAGTYPYFYPRYAITGFTRLAHQSYIQMADECGVPGLIALLLTLGFTFAAIGRGLSAPARAANESDPSLNAVIPNTDRVTLCGLLGGLSAAAVQNLGDSDWYVFFLGVTFWALAGLAVGLAEPPASDTKELRKERPRGRWGHAALGILATLMLVRTLGQGVAAAYDRQAATALAGQDPNSTVKAEQAYVMATRWDPLNARYPAYLGLQVYGQREGRLPEAEASLHTAVRLEPSSLNYSRLAAILAQERNYEGAIQALLRGLRVDPNSDTSLQMRLDLSQLLPQTTEYCRQITVIEDSPAGQVRAIGDIVPTQFAIANACVADAAQNPDEARRYYARAAKVLEAYADEGGTINTQRQVQIGDRPDPALDARMRDLYVHVMGRLITLAPPSARPDLESQAALYRKKYAGVIEGASQPGIL